MSDTLSSKKMWSGRFLLCICAAVAMSALSIALAVILWDTRNQNEINGAVLAGMTLMSGLLSSIVTFYFTKPKAQGDS